MADKSFGCRVLSYASCGSVRELGGGGFGGKGGENYNGASQSQMSKVG